MKPAILTRTETRSRAKRIPIVVRLDGATEVAVTGDFIGWARRGVRLSTDGRGVWRTVLALPPGEYQYRLIVDGQWRDHEAAEKRVPNPYGTENCVLVVS